MYFDHISKKTIADDLIRIDIRELNKAGFLCDKIDLKDVTSRHNISLTGSITDKHQPYIDVQFDTEDKRMGYARIQITSTPCYFGGYRYWFLCPGIGRAPCNERVAVLYLNDSVFACRHCHNLTYKSKVNSNNKYWLLEKLNRIVQGMHKLKEGGARRFYASKPTKKYLKLIELDRQGKECEAVIAKSFGRIN